MICFLTSSTIPPDADAMTLNSANGFAAALRERLPAPCRALFVCSDPEDWERTDRFAAGVRESFADAGITFSSCRTLDSRNASRAAELVRDSELLILAGGHVPTQNRFFHQIALDALLRRFHGVLVGISAGSMNCAAVVYAQPEEPGEATDPAYVRFLPGLGLTKTMLIPHYQAIRNDVLDGLRVMEDIAYPDSRGRRFYLIPDGSYLFIENGRETLCGEAYLLADGVLTQISRTGETVHLQAPCY